MKFVLALLVIAPITSGCEGTTIFISTSPSTIVVRAGHVDGGAIVVGRPVALGPPRLPGRRSVREHDASRESRFDAADFGQAVSPGRPVI